MTKASSRQAKRAAGSGRSVRRPRDDDLAETGAHAGRIDGMRPLHVTLAALAALAAAVTLARPSTSNVTPTERQPVLVELFSSEGCSSCPPADAVLARLSKEQPVAGAEVIALELHVDYWNDLGWSDPFSNAAFSERQRAYMDAFGQRGAYTPQMVIDGHAELIGSNGPAARAAIAAAAREPRARIAIARSGDKVSITVEGLPDGEVADLWLAITEDDLSTAVPRGENAGETLAHGPVVRSLHRVLEINPGTRGPVQAKDVPVSVEPTWNRAALRAVGFVQRRASRRIAGTGAVSLK
ncbi:DUF1223 domain-containing protein [Sorangium sp. So ce1078]|uniref:DUF1223 domain-containing protein n=1 Tax=Sorangium sp. So ce1078 TaxID=3133329 RepID=UPI003F5FF5D8